MATRCPDQAHQQSWRMCVKRVPFRQGQSTGPQPQPASSGGGALLGLTRTATTKGCLRRFAFFETTLIFSIRSPLSWDVIPIELLIWCPSDFAQFHGFVVTV